MTEAQLRAFVTVADAGSFRAAAARLHMSQPGVSRAIKTLEGELGGELFRRASAGSVALTALGERVVVRARTILGEAEAMRQARDEEHGIARGRVRLGSMPSVSESVLPGLLARVERRHPALQVAVIDGHDDELVHWVREGVVDVAVVAGGGHDGLALQPFVADALLAVLPDDHALTHGDRVSRPAFAGEPFILTRAGCERLVLAALAEAGVVPDVAHEVSEASSILAMVAEGLGVSVMPGLAARTPPAGVALRPLDPPADRHLFLATNGRGRSPAVAAFLAEAGILTP